jgi:hypothetical protein
VTSTGIIPSQTDLILATVFDYGGNTSLAAGPGFTTDTTNLRTAYGMLQYAINRSTATTPAAVQTQTSFWAITGVALKNHVQ